MRTIVAALFLLASIPLFATPSTLVTIPSTDIQPKGVWHLGADSVVPTDGSPAFVDVGLTYGVTERFEVGIDYISGTTSPVWGNAKFLLIPADQSPVAVAAGIYNTGTSNLVNQQIAYAVGSTSLAGIRLTFGGYTGNDDALGGDDTGYLLGLDRTQGKWWLGADYASGENAIGSWNLGVGYALTDKVGFIVGYDNFNSDALPDAFNIQFDVNF